MAMNSPKPTEKNGATLLIVEDSPTQAEQLRFVLEERGYGVTTATNGKEALAAASAGRPSVIVSDIVMPVAGLFTGRIEFSNHFLALGPIPGGVPHTLEAVRKAGVPVIAWGSFAHTVLSFAILALVVFVMVRQVNRLRRRTPPAPAAPPGLFPCTTRERRPVRPRVNVGLHPSPGAGRFVQRKGGGGCWGCGGLVPRTCAGASPNGD